MPHDQLRALLAWIITQSIKYSLRMERTICKNNVADSQKGVVKITLDSDFNCLSRMLNSDSNHSDEHGRQDTDES